MRKIKFRAWIEDDGKWFMTYDLAFEEYDTINNLLGGVKYLMQYTNLKDKKGKEIYEGDIISYDNALFKVVFIPGEIGMKRISEEKSKPTYWLHKIQGEIIGNIYETPQL